MSKKSKNDCKWKKFLKNIFSFRFMSVKDFLMELENDGLEDTPELSDGDKTAEGGSGDAGKIAFGGKRKIRRAEESREETISIKIGTRENSSPCPGAVQTSDRTIHVRENC